MKGTTSGNEPDFSEVLESLRSPGKEPSNVMLAELSNPSADELQQFGAAFKGLDAKRRLKIMQTLVEMAEDNVELSFDDVFKQSLRDDDESVRATAIEGLWENEEPSRIRVLIGMLEHDKSEKVQAAAAIALGKFVMLGVEQKLRDTYNESMQKSLLTALNDPVSAIEVKRRALEAIAPVSIPEVRQAIKNAYKSKIPKLKVSAIYSMGRSCESEWLPILKNELQSEDAEMRYEAARAIGEIGDGEAVPALEKLVDDKDADVQTAAIEALGKIDSPQARECLKVCCTSKSETVRTTAQQVLQELKTQEDPLPFRM
jgi:HEAT repeat protein